MDLNEQLSLLQQAQGDPVKLALASVDITYPNLPEKKRIQLKQALQATAVPHWCDSMLLATLLQISMIAAEELLTQLQNLNIIEPFRARGAQAVNVHEATRLLLRKRMLQDDFRYFQALSTRARDYFETDLSPSGRIEWIYHYLLTDPEKGAVVLQALDQDWSNQAYPEDYYALAFNLNELLIQEMLTGLAQIEVLLCVGNAKVSRGQSTQVEELASKALFLSKSARYRTGEARANGLLGNYHQSYGNLIDAKQLFDQYLTINRELAEQNPGNAGLKLELATAYIKVGSILQVQDQLQAAQLMFEQSLAIIQELVEKDSNNAGYQREFAAAYSWIVNVLQAQGQLQAAQLIFDQYLMIIQRLAEQDPNNASWQRGLAIAYGWIGSILQAQGQLQTAQSMFEQYLTIIQRSVEQDPSNADWQRDLAVAYSRIGDVLIAQGKSQAAQPMFEQCLTISQQLAEQDPSNSGWQRDLAVTYSRIGDVLLTQGQLQAAQPMFEQCLTISQRLAEQDPSNTVWQQNLANALQWQRYFETKTKL